jgi:hypothetical protein
MNDSTNRRLLIIFGLCILLSVGAILIGFMGIVDILDSDLFQRVQDWIAPLVSIRSDSWDFDSGLSIEEGFDASDVEATRMADQSEAIFETFADWPILIDESFTGNQIDWPEFETEDELAELDVQISEGKYRWQARANDGFVWWAYPAIDPLTDFYAEIDVAQVSGDPYGEIGLVFRLVEDEYYLFEVSGGEYYSLWRSRPGGWSEIIDWTTSGSIAATGVNKLAVLAQGERFMLFINGNLVYEVSDNSLPEGVVGVAIGLDEEGTNGVFEFDNLIIQVPSDLLESSEEMQGG